MAKKKVKKKLTKSKTANWGVYILVTLLTLAVIYVGFNVIKLGGDKGVVFYEPTASATGSGVEDCPQGYTSFLGFGCVEKHTCPFPGGTASFTECTEKYKNWWSSNMEVFCSAPNKVPTCKVSHGYCDAYNTPPNQANCERDPFCKWTADGKCDEKDFGTKCNGKGPTYCAAIKGKGGTGSPCTFYERSIYDGPKDGVCV